MTSTIGPARTLTLTLALALLTATVAAQQVTTGPLDTVPEGAANAGLKLSLNSASHPTPPNEYAIAPLTEAAGLNQTDLSSDKVMRANLVAIDSSNYLLMDDSDAIAFLSCDDNGSFVTPDDMLLHILSTRPSGVMLYSATKPCCSLGGDKLSALETQAVWTMTKADDALQIQDVTKRTEGSIAAAVYDKSAGEPAPSAPSGDGGGGGGGSSSVAMAILYSITGLIAVLFLIIITTGAVRAHRHPERYGPRGANMAIGLTRQSRAKGLARAVLDTLPIVKFGGPTQPRKPDPEQELESVAGDRDPQRAISSASDRRASGPPAAAAATVAATDGSANDESEASPVGTAAPAPGPSAGPSPEAAAVVDEITEVPRPAEEARAQQDITEAPEPAQTTEGVDTAATAAAAPPADASSADDHIGCSICTEDFNMGEDVRLLPCGHQFHPPCIDPWLVNVSGTCPMCRLDLRKSPEPAEQPADALAAPAAPTPTPTPEGGRRRISRLLDWNRLRHASVDERLHALRQLRQHTRQQQQQQQQHQEEGEAGEAGEGAAADNNAGGNSSSNRHSHSHYLAERLRERLHKRSSTASAQQAGDAQAQASGFGSGSGSGSGRPESPASPPPPHSAT